MQELSAPRRTLPFLLVATVIIAPLLLLSLFFLKSHYGLNSFHGLTHNRSFKTRVFLLAPFLFVVLILFILSFFLKRFSITGYFILATFCVYGFFVLKLTGYFDLSLRLAEQNWLDILKERIRTHERINLTPFKVFHIYKVTSRQVLGNLVMLFPLGIYLGLLMRRSSFLKAVAIIVAVTVSVELMQLLTNYR